jgi:protein-disulfide isomerase
MKRIVMTALAALVSISTFAADEAALRTYATKALPMAPDAVVSLDPIPRVGPTNFQAYTLTLKSSDEYANAQKFLLYSPKTKAVIIGGVIALPTDGRPASERLREHVSAMLKKPFTVNIAPFPLPDGLKAVSMKRDTDYGTLTYHGFLDQSEQFLVIGLRGNLNTDPSRTLLDALGLENAVRRGAAKPKATVIELSDFQCPSCGRAHKKLEPLIAKNLNSIQFLRLDLPLFEAHQWAVPAALGARAINKVAPAKYWQYVDYIFENQEAIEKRPFDDVIKDFASDHDISWSAIEKIYRSKAERQAIMDQVGRAFDAGIFSTPTFIVNGQQVNFGEGTFAYEKIRAAAGVKAAPAAKPAAAKPAAKPAAKKK